MPRDPVELRPLWKVRGGRAAALVNFLRGSGMNIASGAERVAGL